jgi:hypothetical protein
LVLTASSLELGGGSALANGFRWEGARDEGEFEGNSPRSLWGSRGWRLGLAAVGGSSIQRRMVVALPGGSPVEVRGKTASPCSGEAPGLVSWVRGAAV